MAATRYVWTPLDAEMPSLSPAKLGESNDRPTLGFPSGLHTHALFTGVYPQVTGASGSLTLECSYIAATVNDDFFVVANVEAVTPGDALDLSSASDFGGNNTNLFATPASANALGQFSLSLTFDDAIAPGDYFRIRFWRDGDNPEETLSASLYLLSFELRES